MTKPLIHIDGLKTYFHTEDQVVRAVDDINLEISPGYTLGLVGESGSGKSVTSLSIMRLLPRITAKIEAGSISFLGKDIVKLSESQMTTIRGGEISMIFQEPGTSLNPVFRTGDQVMEAIRLHQDVSKDEARNRTIELYREVGIPEPERRIASYPHEMSGGQKQRVMIAMALSCNPQLLIADEPTTALDVTIQKQILDLIRELRDQRDMAILFITHDLGVIAEIADHVAVMLRGKIVEHKPALELFQNPEHPYTRGLLNCRPRLDTSFRRLPTVSDFMDLSFDSDGTFTVTEKVVDQAELDRLTIGTGRSPQLHPATAVKKLGYSSDPSTYNDTPQFVGDDQKPVLHVTDLKVHFPIKAGLLGKVVGHVKAVDGITFDVYPGQTLGLVGESGCGKTTAGRAIVKLLHKTAGQVHFKGRDLDTIGKDELRQIRSDIQIIFQDPFASLNPRMTVESMLSEAMRIHRIGDNFTDRRDRAAALLEEVDLPPEHLSRYPHEFSGGQRQRICIARALAVEPEFLICDESVSALDVSVQAQVLNLLNDLQDRRKLTYIFISHDLSVVKFMSDMMAVMNDGKFVEFGPSESIYANPREEYTQKLIQATPRDDLENIERLVQKRKAIRDRKEVASRDPSESA